MKSSQVCWLEGSLVLPHHFQAEAANLQYWASANTNWTIPFHYGLCQIQFELTQEKLRIDRLKARLRDGSMISVPENATVPSLNFKQPLEQSPDKGLYLYLTLPDLRPGRQNAVRTDDGADEDERRYFIRQRKWYDVNVEDDARPIDVYDYNVRIKYNTTPQPPDGFASIPLLRILPPTEQSAAASIDPDIFPPLLSCGCWPKMKELLGHIESLLDKFIKKQAHQLALVDAWNQPSNPEVQRAIARQVAANASYPVLSSLISLTRWSEEDTPLHVLHPFVIYQELCRLIGQLGIVEQGWIARTVPSYDHDNLGSVFRELKILLDRLLDTDGPTRLEQLPFIGKADWLEISIARWLQDGCEYYIGVGSDLSTRAIQQLFSSQHLDWKLGGRSAIARIYKNAELGLRLEACGDCPPDLPHVTGRTYFRVEAKGAYWDELKQDPAQEPVLALWLNPNHVQGSFIGTNRVTVFDHEGNAQELAFWLYVVQHESRVSSQGSPSGPGDA